MLFPAAPGFVERARVSHLSRVLLVTHAGVRGGRGAHGRVVPCTMRAGGNVFFLYGHRPYSRRRALAQDLRGQLARGVVDPAPPEELQRELRPIDCKLVDGILFDLLVLQRPRHIREGVAIRTDLLRSDSRRRGRPRCPAPPRRPLWARAVSPRAWEGTRDNEWPQVMLRTRAKALRRHGRETGRRARAISQRHALRRRSVSGRKFLNGCRPTSADHQEIGVAGIRNGHDSGTVV